MEALRAKQTAAEKSYVDFGLYGLLAEDNIDQLPALIDGGVNAFKCFMGNTFGNLPSPSTGAMLEGFEVIAPPACASRCMRRTASIMAWRQKQAGGGGPNDALAHLASRPAVVAIEAVGARRDPRRMDRRAHPCAAHLLGRGTAAACVKPRRAASTSPARPARTTCCSTSDDYAELGAIIRVNPPVREKHTGSAHLGGADRTARST